MGWTEEGRDLPVTRVSWDEARRFCEVAWPPPTDGGRVGVRGARRGGAQVSVGRQAPPDEKRAVFGRSYPVTDKPEPVTSHPDGQGPFGTFHQAGNVWEWGRMMGTRSDSYKPLVNKVTLNPPSPYSSPAVVGRVLRGGAFDGAPWFLRSANRDWRPARGPALGRRVPVRSRPAPPALTLAILISWFPSLTARKGGQPSVDKDPVTYVTGFVN